MSMPFLPHLDLSDPLVRCLVRILHISIRNCDTEGVVVDTPSDADIMRGAILSSLKKRPALYVIWFVGYCHIDLHCLSLQMPN